MAALAPGPALPLQHDLQRHHPLQRIAVLIPAWNPDQILLPLITTLVERGIGALILVDDGSTEEFTPLFSEAAAFPSVFLLRHAVNLGKGRALKTGINFFLSTLSPDSHFDALITADADGQHTPDDILRVATAATGHPETFVLGSRVFARDVPLRSRFGNLLTRRIFAFVTGTLLADTQTGLRAFPNRALPSLLTLEGERYEYEMTVLAHLCRGGRKPLEVPIQTIYLDNNHSSHFDPIRDSMRIYFVLLRFYLSSIFAAALDFAGFTFAFAITGNVLLSVVFGRLSSLVNFALNKRFVFHSRASLRRTLARYYALVVVVAAISYGLIWTLTSYLHWNVFAAKISVDILLSLVSFSAQRTFVFTRREEA
jgi:glycosyltransferase involved in cell wall biosynthesis